jgi:large subunit ribosomal protein L3
VLNLRVIDLLPEENAVLLSGAVPGADGSLVMVRHAARPKKRGAAAVANA